LATVADAAPDFFAGAWSTAVAAPFDFPTAALGGALLAVPLFAAGRFGAGRADGRFGAGWRDAFDRPLLDEPCFAFAIVR